MLRRGVNPRAMAAAMDAGILQLLLTNILAGDTTASTFEVS